MKKEKKEKIVSELQKKILKLTKDIREEFDLIEFVENELEDIFGCDGECMTCTEEERGVCMQTFKKANILWLRKLRQDEEVIHSICEKAEELMKHMDKMHKEITEDKDYLISIKKDKYREKLEKKKDKEETYYI